MLDCKAFLRATAVPAGIAVASISYGDSARPSVRRSRPGAEQGFIQTFVSGGSMKLLGGWTMEWPEAIGVPVMVHFEGEDQICPNFRQSP